MLSLGEAWKGDEGRYVDVRPFDGSDAVYEWHRHAIPPSYMLILDDMIPKLDMLARKAAGEELVARATRLSSRLLWEV